MPTNIDTTTKLGRKPIHKSPAARAAAYRARKAEKIAAALALAAQPPDTTELDALKKQLQASQDCLRMAETNLERCRAKSASSHSPKGSTPGKPRSSSDNRMEALRKYYVDGGWPRPEDAKRLRVSTKKASGAAKEIFEVIGRLHFEMRDAMAGDLDALAAAAALLADYGNSLEKIQKDAAFAVEVKAVTQKRANDALVIQTIDEILPDVSTRKEDARRLAEDLVNYETEGRTWLATRHHTARGTPHVNNDFHLANAIKIGDGAQIQRLVAECKIEMATRGRSFMYNGETCWMGGWEDFIEWRKEDR
ncbi:hypothetical protein [Propionivibrio sp.]|uniref:hypothetical protein n=1 Tax=Propionivibrio sp. TaxID=2212460 RepID=UPI003BF39824